MAERRGENLFGALGHDQVKEKEEHWLCTFSTLNFQSIMKQQ